MLSTVKKRAGAPLPRNLEKLFEEHGRFILGVAYRVTGNWTAAEDILQGLFLRLLQSNRIGDLESNPKGYLYRSAVNMSLDLIRRERLDPSGDAIEQHRIMAADQVRQYESAEIQESFRIALAKLSPKAAEMFILKHLEGYENHEIAQMLDTSRGTVAVTLFRSRAFLKKSMRRFRGARQGEKR
jgi:RNA polymerase sigma-70 factor (ECF subfamily)